MPNTLYIKKQGEWLSTKELPNGGRKSQVLGKVADTTNEVAWIEQKECLPKDGKPNEHLIIDNNGQLRWSLYTGSPTNHIGDIVYSIGSTIPDGCLETGTNFFQGDYPELYDLLPEQTAINPASTPNQFLNYLVTEEYKLANRDIAVQELGNGRYLINGKMLVEAGENSDPESGDGYNWDSMFNEAKGTPGANYSHVILNGLNGEFYLSWINGEKYAPFLLQIKSYDNTTNHRLSRVIISGLQEDANDLDLLYDNTAIISQSLLSFNIQNYDPKKLYNKLKINVTGLSSSNVTSITSFKLYATDNPNKNIYKTKTIPSNISDAKLYVVAEIKKPVELTEEHLTGYTFEGKPVYERIIWLDTGNTPNKWTTVYTFDDSWDIEYAISWDGAYNYDKIPYYLSSSYYIYVEVNVQQKVIQVFQNGKNNARFHLRIQYTKTAD